jgi:allantoicase
MAIITLDPNAPEFTRRYPNLADPRLGARTLACSDDFFAEMARMLNPEPAVFIPGKYDTNGKWMDGWESRRKRVNGHDWCVLKLGRAGILKGVDIDTSHFTGNYPPAAAIEGAFLASGEPDDQTVWQEVLPSVNLQGNSHHYHEISSTQVFTHLRLNIYPDGGVARLRVYAQPANDWANADPHALHDLIAMENGGYIVATNNQHFGLASNLLMPGRGVNMGDGWETRRRREPGNDWCIIALAHAGIVQNRSRYLPFQRQLSRQLFDTGSIHGGRHGHFADHAIDVLAYAVTATKAANGSSALFCRRAAVAGAITHIRLNIFPDGGVSRLRLLSKIA